MTGNLQSAALAPQRGEAQHRFEQIVVGGQLERVRAGVRQPGAQPDGSVPGYGPSAVVHPSLAASNGVAPHVMTETDIGDVVNAFARSARHAEALGFDGVELHGAHGYLIDQFFWAATNRRTDHHGGGLPGRTRFAMSWL